MGCEVKTTDLGNGHYVAGIYCSRGRAARKCQWCSKPSTKLCDAPVKGVTCDARMCNQHATSIGPNRDVCPDHVSVRV